MSEFTLDCVCVCAWAVSPDAAALVGSASVSARRNGRSFTVSLDSISHTAAQRPEITLSRNAISKTSLHLGTGQSSGRTCSSLVPRKAAHAGGAGVTPVFRALQKDFPYCAIDVVVNDPFCDVKYVRAARARAAPVRKRSGAPSAGGGI